MKLDKRIHSLTMAAMFGAISALLMYVKFPLPLVPPFIEFDFTDAVNVISGFILGPSYAVLVIFIKWIIKLLLQGTSTGMIGELSGFLLNLIFVLPPAILYKKKHCFFSAVLGMLIGAVLCSLTAVFSNIYVMFPLYGMDAESVISAFSAVNPLIHNLWTMALFSLIPFNLLKTGVSSVLASVIYKRIEKSLHER